MSETTVNEMHDADTSELETLRAEVSRLREELEDAKRGPQRKRLPDTRDSLTHKFSISGHEGYLTAGIYPDGSPGEVFIKMAKQGSTVSGLVDTIAVLISVALQYGGSAGKLGPQVRAHTVRAFRPHVKPGDRAGFVNFGLRVQVAWLAILRGVSQGTGREMIRSEATSVREMWLSRRFAY